MTAESIAKIGNVLLYGSVPLLLVYFFLFFRTIASLDESERRRFTKDGALPVWRRILALAPFPVVVFVDDAVVRSAAVLWLLVQLFLDTRAHHQRLVAAAFSPAFMKRMTRISILAGAATLALLSGIALGGGLLPIPAWQETDDGSDAPSVDR